MSWRTSSSGTQAPRHQNAVTNHHLNAFTRRAESDCSISTDVDVLFCILMPILFQCFDPTCMLTAGD